MVDPDLLNKDIRETEVWKHLRTRTRNALCKHPPFKAAGKCTVEDLATLTKQELRNIVGFGDLALYEVGHGLKAIGLEVGELAPSRTMRKIEESPLSYLITLPKGAKAGSDEAASALVAKLDELEELHRDAMFRIVPFSSMPTEEGGYAANRWLAIALRPPKL